MQQKDKGLLRSFGLKMAIIIVMSSIIGSGVFKKVAPMAEGLHTAPWVMIAWLLAGLIVMFGVLSIGELGAIFPHSGGPFAWLEKIYGKLVSFLYGWGCFTVIQTAAIASIAYVFSGAVSTFIDLPRLSPELESITYFGIISPFANIGGKIVAAILTIALTIVNIAGAKKGGNISLVFTFLITLCIIAISCVALSSSVGSLETFNTPSVNYPAGGFTLFSFLGVLVIAMRDAFWGYEGWVTLGFIGEELKEPRKTLPRAMVIGILLITGLYVLINFAYLYVMPIDEMISAVNADENNIAAVVVVNKLLGEGGAKIISAMILISTFGCTNATILVSSRIYYAMAKERLFFKGAAKTHSKNNTPSNALIYQCIWACILIFSGSFDLLTDLVIIAGFIFYGLIVLGVIILRKRKKDLDRPYKTLGYPVVPWLFVLFCVVLLLTSFFESPAKSLMGILLVLSGLPFYYYWKRNGGSKQEPEAPEPSLEEQLP